MEKFNYKYAFFNLGTMEIVVILLIVLLLFGSKKLPELVRGLGKGINEFKDAIESGKSAMSNDSEKKEEEEDK